MARARRSNDWGFPRWRAYGGESTAARVRICDREGCNEPGDCPAPKAPESRERWYFCTEHAAEYNRGWNYFEGLDQAEAEARVRAEARTSAGGYRQSAHHQWAGPGDGSRSRDEMRALGVLALDSDADFAMVRVRWRQLAKDNHPDVNQGDPAAAERFRAAQAAYDVLRAAEERRGGHGAGATRPRPTSKRPG